MSKSRIHHAIDTYRQRLLAREQTATQALEDAYAHVLRTIQLALDRLYDQMANALADGKQLSISWLYEAQRLETIKRLISGQIDHFAALSKAQVTQMQRQAALLGQEAAQAMLQATVPPGVNFAFGIPDPKAIANIIGATQAGSPLADLFNGFGAEAAKGAANALIRGITLGKNPRAIAGDVQQALGISRNRALVISRTEMLRAYRSANLETFRANSDVVDKWRWTCAQSARTCAACLAMDGSLHDLSEDMGSHPCCRCVQTPVTKDWSEILGPLGIDTSNIPDTRPDIQSGEDWFDQQDESIQRQILGNAGYDAWKNNDDITLKSFVGKSSDSDWGDSIFQRSVKSVLAGK